ncbi:MAG: response regulator [Syntrophobacteraceae bacterium]
MPHKCRVLLAEDNPVNQDVGRAMLETFGCHVDVAENGIEAVRLLELNSYDLVFMDCQMPKMNGWEAALQIRKAEKTSPGRTPIVALTAYSMDQEREKCRAAGMDDFLGKPFGLRELSEVLKRWVKLDQNGDVLDTNPAEAPLDSPEPRESQVSLVPGDEQKEPTCIDPSVLDNLGSAFGSNSPNILSMVANLYFSNSPTLLEELRVAMNKTDIRGIGEAAHTLRSTSANLGANVLADLCRRVEERSRQGITGNMEELIQQIETEYLKVRAALREILRSGS